MSGDILNQIDKIFQKDNNENTSRRFKDIWWKDGNKILPSSMKLIEFGWIHDFKEKYKFHKLIGEGRYGKVYKATNLITQEIVACKVVPRKHEYLRELNHLISLENCYGVLHFNNVVFSRSRMLIELPLAECTLYTAIKKLQKMKDPVDYLKLMLYWFEEIVKSVDDIHRHRIIHRDIKTGNIVIVKNPDMMFEGNETVETHPWHYIPKIIDFGISKRIINDIVMSDTINYNIITVYYRPPELFRKQKCYEYSKKTESWSLGCILAEMLLGTILFKPKDIKHFRPLLSHYISSYLGYDPYSLMDQKHNVDDECSYDGSSCTIDSNYWNFAYRIENSLLNKISENININTKELGSGIQILENINSHNDKIQFITIFRGFRFLLSELLHPISNKRIEMISVLKFIQLLKILMIETIHASLTPYSKTLYQFIEGSKSPSNCSISDFFQSSYYQNQESEAYNYRLFYDYPHHRIINRNIKINKDHILNIFANAVKFARYYKFNPKIFYLGIYVWFSIIFDNEYEKYSENINPETVLLYTFSTINEYSYSKNAIFDCLKQNDIFSQFTKDERPEYYHNIIIALKRGRIWIHNPGEVRHLFLNDYEIEKSWNDSLDSMICDIIYETVNKELRLPSPDEIAYLCVSKIYK